MTATASTRVRSEAGVVAYLGFTSALLAIGIDTALPAFDEIREEFSLADGSGEVSLVVTAYFLGMAAGQLPMGPLSDRFGRRPVLLASFALYLIGALGATLAPSFGILLGARFLWGLGAAGPAVIGNAIARDLYSGDQMARVLSLTMAVFLIGPTIAPLLGEMLLLTGAWQAVFLVGFALALVGAAWTFRFGETLPDDRRRPIDPPAVGRAIRTTMTNRASAGYILAMVFSYGAFFVFLGSSQPIVDEVYGRPGWFAATFACTSAVNGFCVWQASRHVHRIGAARLALLAYGTNAGGFAVMLVAALTSDGVPPLVVWVVLVTVTSTSGTLVSTTAISLALQPMERIAGTAAALRGTFTLGCGSLLASLVDRQIVDTITPMAVGGTIYCGVGLLLLLWARGGSLEVVDPDIA